MSTRWTITFKTLNDKTVVVSIGDSDYSGTPIVLTPAPSAFSLTKKQEEMNSPVMSETGYIRIIKTDELQDVEDIHPTGALERPVSVTIDNSLVWRGYVSPEVFSSDFTSLPYEVEFPVVGLLDVLQAVSIADTDVALVTIGSLLQECLTATGQPWDYMQIARQMTQIYESYLSKYEDCPELRIQVSRYNFLEPNNVENKMDADWTPYIGQSYYTVLSEICRYFGWTACTQGTTFVLKSARKDVTQITSLSYSEVSAISLDPRAAFGVSIITRQTVTNLVADGLAHRRSIRNGRKRVTIVTNLNERKDIMPSINYDGAVLGTFQESIDFDSNPVTYHVTGRILVLDPTYEYVKLRAWRTDAITLVGYHEVDWNVPEEPEDLCLPQAYLVRGMSWENASPPLNYVHRDMIRIACDESYQGPHFHEDVKMITIRSKGVGAFVSGSALSINGTVYNSFATYWGVGDRPLGDKYGITYWSPFNNNIRCSLRIGNKWWTGMYWDDHETIFGIPAGIKQANGTWDYTQRDAHVSGAIINNKTIEMPWSDASGYIIPITDNIIGDVEINIYPWIKNTPGTGLGYDYTCLYIENFKIDYHNRFNSTNNLRLSALTGREFTDELTCQLQLTSAQDDRIGHALLWYRNSPVGHEHGVEFHYGTQTLYRPEKYLLETLLKLYSSTCETLELEVEYDSTINMSDLVTVGDKNYIIAGVAIDYANEHMTITLMNYE